LALRKTAGSHRQPNSVSAGRLRLACIGVLAPGAGWRAAGSLAGHFLVDEISPPRGILQPRLAGALVDNSIELVAGP